MLKKNRSLLNLEIFLFSRKGVGKEGKGRCLTETSLDLLSSCGQQVPILERHSLSIYTVFQQLGFMSNCPVLRRFSFLFSRCSCILG